MLEAVRRRIGQLEDLYRGYCNGKSSAGVNLTYGGAATLRSNTKRDLGLLHLMEYLLLYCPDTIIIDDADVQKVFDRLTEPRG